MTVALYNIVNTSHRRHRIQRQYVGGDHCRGFPTLFVYIVAGRYFVRGLMAGAVKG